MTTAVFEAFAEQVRQNYADLANPFTTYQALIEGLESIDRLTILPLRELAETNATDTRVLGLRHDIDGDPLTAIRLSRHLASRGIGGSFYLLHTAGYYGVQEDGRLVRNPALAGWVRDLIVSGCEIGVHNDAFGSTPQTLVDEIEWLRSQDAIVRGTVAHNSAPAYGGANSEVFVGRRLGPVDRPLPLESLDERDLGLTYEGTFAVPSPNGDETAAARFRDDRAGASVRCRQWMRAFLVDNPTCGWDVDVQIWLIGRDEWVIASGDRAATPIFEWCVDLRRVLAAIDERPDGARIVVVLHPEYFGISDP
jgi:hypothetical protein